MLASASRLDAEAVVQIRSGLAEVPRKPPTKLSQDCKILIERWMRLAKAARKTHQKLRSTHEEIRRVLHDLRVAMAEAHAAGEPVPELPNVSRYDDGD